MRSIPTALCCIGLAAFASCGPVDAPPEEETPEATSIALIEALMRVWESGDVSGLDTLFSPTATYADMPNDRVLSGLSEIEGYVSHVHGWAKDISLDVKLVKGASDFAYAEWSMCGVQDRPIPGTVPVATNNPFCIDGLTTVALEGGRIRQAVDYIQIVPLMLQLGGRIELPGGVVLPPPGPG